MAEVPSATPVRCQAAPTGEHSTRGARSFTQGQHKASGKGLGTHFPIPHVFGTRSSLPSAGTALALRARCETGDPAPVPGANLARRSRAPATPSSAPHPLNPQDGRI